eukprot:TRINITY_DN79899_c0_g1_i1.p1 TRINITY_DN79899_c0_g1~~TRINITY_DN79899_c0_g1_i1.p1  ORF type:complete len:197 (+),score=30.47 TRINITY_DN79899_c0_g1_i1:112-702(+)
MKTTLSAIVSLCLIASAYAASSTKKLEGTLVAKKEGYTVKNGGLYISEEKDGDATTHKLMFMKGFELMTTGTSPHDVSGAYLFLTTRDISAKKAGDLVIATATDTKFPLSSKTDEAMVKSFTAAKSVVIPTSIVAAAEIMKQKGALIAIETDGSPKTYEVIAKAAFKEAKSSAASPPGVISAVSVAVAVAFLALQK